MVRTLFIAFFSLAAIWFAVGVFHTKSMVRSALALLFCQTAIGALFLAMETEFLGVLQIMMMATEMSIMAIFMVMFMMDPGGMGEMEMTHQKRASIAAGALAVLGAVVAVWWADWGALVAVAPDAAAQTRALGKELMGRSMIVFETAGVSILTAMIAATAVAIAKRSAPDA